MNGQAFLHARDALRGRPPLVVEWKGPHRSIGDEAVPADLRVDHVYLVSCKYLSDIVVNASPEHLFDRLLKGGHGQRTGNDWYEEVAAAEHVGALCVVRDAVDVSLPPPSVADLTANSDATSVTPTNAEVRGPATATRSTPRSSNGWRLHRRTAGGKRSARARSDALATPAHRERPYFVLGASAKGFMRLRIATPWDWRQHFELRKFSVEPRVGGQPMIGWEAIVRRRADGGEMPVRGYVEIRWSHRRFGAPPEAKVHLETPHAEVPGYFALD